MNLAAARPRSAAATQPRVLVPLEMSPQAPVFGAQVHGFGGASMGTTWSVQRLGQRVDTKGPRLQALAEQVLAEVVAQMSPWEPGSDISRFNHAPAGSRHELPPAFCAVLGCALQVAAMSEGAYDPTAGALVDLWGFGPGPRHNAPGFVPPDAAAVAAARALGGWQRLVFDGPALQQPGGLRLDFSAIAKGYAADLIAQRLQAAGVLSALVEVGGELVGYGNKADGQPWWVAIETPPLPAGVPAPAPTRLALHGLAVATSGDYRRSFFDADGRRRPHTLDPRIGEPVSHGLAAVSVVHRSCMWADALSTAIMVLGLADGLRFAATHGVAALLVQRRDDGSLEEHLSPALAELAL